MILCPYSVWVAWKNRTRFFVARGWEGVCYILDEGIFLPMYRLFPHASRIFFYTGRPVTMLSSDNLRYHQVPWAG